MRIRHILAVLLVAAALLTTSGPAGAGSDPASDEAAFVAMINRERELAELNPLIVDPQLQTQARAWAQVMADDDELKHATDLAVGITADWAVLGENVGVHSEPDLNQLFQAFVNSPPHYANLLDPRFQYIGVGVVYEADGTMWTTHRFMGLRPPAPPPTVPPTNAPLTTVAPTASPLTTAPFTTAPPTTAPSTTAPHPTSPPITVPPATAPRLATVPPTTAPRPTTSPPTTTPVTRAGPFVPAPTTATPPPTTTASPSSTESPSATASLSANFKPPSTTSSILPAIVPWTTAAYDVALAGAERVTLPRLVPALPADGALIQNSAPTEQSPPPLLDQQLITSILIELDQLGL